MRNIEVSQIIAVRVSGEIVKGDIVEGVIALGEIAVDQTVDRRN